MTERTATKLADEHTALARREEQFRTLVENIPGVIYRCACDEHWTMEFISDTIGELSGYPADEFIDNRVRSYASIIHRKDQALVDRAVTEGTNARRPYIIEYRIVDAGGAIRWVYEKGQGVFDAGGELLWLDGAIFDVTDRKTADERLAKEQTLLRKMLNLRERKLMAYDRG
jgi:PAS domain S-box-containing protein